MTVMIGEEMMASLLPLMPLQFYPRLKAEIMKKNILASKTWYNTKFYISFV